MKDIPQRERRAAIAVVALLLGILIVLVQGTHDASWPPGVAAAGNEPGGLGAGTQTEDPPDVIIVGWDGVQRDHFWECYNEDPDECRTACPSSRSGWPASTAVPGT